MLVTTLGYGHAVPSGCVALVQLHRTRGARFHVSGIPWTAGRSALSRIYAAFETCDLPRISGAFTLHIRPMDGVQDFAALDLPIALALLAQAGVVPSDSLVGTLSVGEMALDGQLQEHRQDVAPAFQCSDRNAPPVHTLLLPEGMGRNILALAPSGRAFRSHHLTQAISFLQEKHPLPTIALASPWKHRTPWNPETESVWNQLQLSDLYQEALMTAAIGQLPLLIMGSSGSGKSQMARALHELLPKLSQEEHTEIEAVHQQRDIAFPATERPPFRAPHHRCSSSGLIGTMDARGRWVPGEWSLAHRGTLCFDELAEFSRDCIESFRGPLDNGEWHLARANNIRTLRSSSWVVATSNPCPCGRLHDGPEACACSPSQVRQYLLRISGPVADRFTLHLETSGQPRPETPSTVDIITARAWVHLGRERVHAAPSESWTVAAKAHIAEHIAHFHPSIRGQEQLKKIARAHAALRQARHPQVPRDNRERHPIKIEAADAAFASQMRIFDRPHWWQKPELT